MYAKSAMYYNSTNFSADRSVFHLEQDRQTDTQIQLNAITMP